MSSIEKEPSAIGVYDDLGKAENAIRELRRAGFRSEEIGIIGHVAEDGQVSKPPEMRKPEWNVTDAMFRGGVIGGIVGILVAVCIPALSRIADLGFAFDVMGGAVLGAGVCGMLMAIMSLRFFTPKSRFYDSQLERGRFIITVKNPARKEDAVSVLSRQGKDVQENTGA